ncbi:formylglycine-generating enzyme family protein [bacterium]|nr:formylglycine-generating enzyme family protein [bacterium]
MPDLAIDGVASDQTVDSTESDMPDDLVIVDIDSDLGDDLNEDSPLDQREVFPIDVILEPSADSAIDAASDTETEPEPDPCDSCSATETCVSLLNDGCAEVAAFCADSVYEVDLATLLSAVGIDIGSLSIDTTINFPIVPEGPFLMGLDPDLGYGEDAERPQHVVTMGAYYLQENLVTVGNFFACRTAYEESGEAFGCETGSYKPHSGSALLCNYPDTGTGITDSNDLPMNCISWAGATQFCEWIGGRLPTEAEWEKAARGGCELHGDDPVGCEDEDSDNVDDRNYPWGVDTPDCDRACFYLFSSGCEGDPQSCIVGSRNEDPNNYDHYDMAGNVEEWVYDRYDAGLYLSRIDEDVGCPVVEPTTNMVVARGGWFSITDLTDLRVTARREHTKHSMVPNIGFRCVIDVQPPEVTPP